MGFYITSRETDIEPKLKGHKGILRKVPLDELPTFLAWEFKEPAFDTLLKG